MSEELQSLTRDRGAVEVLAYSFDTMTVDGEAVDPPEAYELALTPLSSYPEDGDWHAAPWTAGPLEQGDYMLRLRFTDTTETPVRRLAVLTVL